MPLRVTLIGLIINADPVLEADAVDGGEALDAPVALIAVRDLTEVGALGPDREFRRARCRRAARPVAEGTHWQRRVKPVTVTIANEPTGRADLLSWD